MDRLSQAHAELAEELARKEPALSVFADLDTRMRLFAASRWVDNQSNQDLRLYMLRAMPGKLYLSRVDSNKATDASLDGLHMQTILSPPEQRVILRNLSWETYQRLLSEHGDGSSPRFTFNRGVLEIMSPSAEHERYNLRIADLIGVLADEMNLEVEGLGASTFTREDLERGFEADSCFYVQNVDKVRNKECVNLETDPPPDLVIEIETTNPSINKLPLFLEFGVPEIWRYNGVRLEMFRLLNSRYEATEESAAFPGVSVTVLTRLLQQGKTLGRTGWLRMTRAWAHERFANCGGPTST